jgi:capsule polysaccharide modification protein KpsS
MIHKGMMKFRLNERRIMIHNKNGPILLKKNCGLIEKAIEVVHP